MARKKKQTQPLTGNALIEKVKQLSELTREEKAKACGYMTTEKDGSERIQGMAFLNALLEADGIDLNSHTSKGNDVGRRRPSYRVSVQANGNILLGKAYTQAMNLKPGEKFAISLGRKHIHLNKVA